MRRGRGSSSLAWPLTGGRPASYWRSVPTPAASGICSAAGPTDVHALRRMLTDLVPGSVLTTPKDGAERAPSRGDDSRRLGIHPPGLPLHTDAAEATTRALLSALATPLQAGEAMAVQVVLGPRRAPRIVPAGASDPSSTLVQVLTQGDRPASSETRSRLKERMSQGGFALTIRLGATSPRP